MVVDLNCLDNDKQTWLIGKTFPIDCSFIDKDAMGLMPLTQESAAVIFHYKKPSAAELYSFKYSKAHLYIKYESKLMVLAVDIDNFGIADCCFHVGRFTLQEPLYMMHATEGTGMQFYLAVVDEKNILRALRIITVSSQFTNKFADIIKYQQTEDGKIAGESEFYQIGFGIYKKYLSIEELVNAADVSYTSGEKI